MALLSLSSQIVDRKFRVKRALRLILKDVVYEMLEAALIRKKAFGCAQSRGPFPFTVNHYGGI